MSFELTDAEFDRLQKEFPYPDKVCPTCGNEGTFIKDGDVSNCNCRAQIAGAQAYYKANIPRRYHSLDIDMFVPKYRALNEGVVEKVELYVEQFQANYFHGRGLALHGPHGTGKTMLATHALKKIVLRYGMRGFFMQFSDVIHAWGAAWKDDDSREMLERNLKRADILVLDDILSDKRNAEGFLQAGLEAVLRSRYNNSLPTIITTNMEENMLQMEFPRAYSIISGVTDWLTLEGPDYRPTNAKEIAEMVGNNERLPVR